MFGWQIDSKSANDYISLCKECIINDEIFSTFKIQKYYNSILEHADKVCGDKYINFIDKYMDFDNIDNKQYIEDCKKNDIYGSPIRFNYQKYDIISSTTLSYIYLVLKMENIFSNFSSFKNIIEIGGGYGGQCYVLSKRINFDTYTIIDLKDVSNLQEKYLNKLNIKNVKYIYPEILDTIKNIKYDLVISCFAWSELSKDIQLLYYNEIIKNSKHGFLRCNICFSGHTLVEMRNLFSDTSISFLMDEVSNDEGAWMIYW